MATGLTVEVAGRLVREQDRRIHDGRAGESDTLALAARELLRQVGLALAEADRIEGGVDLLPPFAARHVGEDHRQLDVLGRRQAPHEVERLKDETDVVAPDLRQLGCAQLADAAAVQPVAAGGRAVETADDVEQRRLARAGRSHDGDVFTLADGLGDPPQGVDGA